jgi:hypothetical protein
LTAADHQTILAQKPVAPDADIVNIDDFVNSPSSALRFISLPLRRTVSTPRDTRFARLDLGLFTKSSIRMTFYEFINIVGS